MPEKFCPSALGVTPGPHMAAGGGPPPRGGGRPAALVFLCVRQAAVGTELWLTRTSKPSRVPCSTPSLSKSCIGS
jgi:hypothetical protein